MCVAAADLYGSCLEAWETDWPAAGYDDRADFLDACETWTWTSRLLEEDADRAGEVDALCRERHELYVSGTCEDFAGTDWSSVPWETTSNTGESDGSTAE
jgi:hypothetical protein